MGLFSKKLSIGEGKKYDTSKVTTNEVLREEAVKKNNKLIKVFNYFNSIDTGESLNSVELANALEFFESLDNGDGKLSKKELQKGADQLNQQLQLEGKEKLKASDLKEFLKNIAKTTQKHQKTDVDKVLEQYNRQQEALKKQEFLENLDKAAQRLGYEPTEREGVYFNKDNQTYIKYDEESKSFKLAKYAEETQSFEYMTEEEAAEALKPKQEVEQEVAEEETPELHSYTVQKDEKFTDIIVRSLKAQGIENPTEEQIQAAKDKFKENNPNAVKTTASGYEYLLVGAKVNLEGALEDKNNSAAQQQAWADEHAVVVQEGFDKEGAKEAKAKGYEATVKANYYVDKESGKFYLYDPEKKEFRESKNTVQVIEDGSFVKDFNNEDGSLKRVIYGDDGYPTGMIAGKKPDEDGNVAASENKEESAQILGLQKTLATDSQGIYYDPKTKMHYHWDNEAKMFIALDKNIRMVGVNGMRYDDEGKNDYLQLRKDGTEVYTQKDGSKDVRTYDPKTGNLSKLVEYTSEGKVESIETYDPETDNISKKVEYDSEGKPKSIKTYDPKTGTLSKVVYYGSKAKYIKTKEFTRDADGNTISSLETYPDNRTSLFTDYDKNGKVTKRINKDANGNIESIYHFTHGKDGSYISQEIDENGNPVGEPEYRNKDGEINKETYDNLQK